MIRAVVWKEFREQGLIALTLVVLGSGVLAGVSALAEPPAPGAAPSDVLKHLGAGLLATLMLAVTAGMVCGGAVFAAEREAGTITFLDALPVSRWRVWRAKLTAGVGLAVAQVALLLGVAAALGLLPTVGWARAITVFALLSFAWGMFGSTVSRTTLGSVGVAIPAAAAASVVVLVPILLFSRRVGQSSIRTTDAVVFMAFMLAVPLALSAWVFTRPDRLRAAEAGAGRPGTRGRAGGRALVWLTTRQARTPALVLSAFALLFGLAFLAPGMQPVLVWPGLALAAGVLTGVTAFADEQTRGVARFWGEQRLPLGRAWAVKVGLHAVLCLWLLVLLAAPSVVRAQFVGRASGYTPLAVVFRSGLFDEMGGQGWKYLLVPAVYGFAAGHLCGLLFRKLVVACGVAGIVGGVGAVAWGPSLLAGGVKHWQLWLAPAAVLVTARFLLPAWSSDRLATRRPLTALAGGCLAAALVTAAGLGYRVLEVPDRPDGEDDIAYVASLPPIDVNPGGSRFRTSVDRFARTIALAPGPDRAGSQTSGPGRRSQTDERLREVVQVGWRGDPELAEWLDRVFDPRSEPDSAPWQEAAAEAATQPIGIYEYPQLVAFGPARDASLLNAHRMSLALVARALQAQAGGDPARFVRTLRTVVALARTLRNGSTLASFQTGFAVDQVALTGLDTWLSVPPAGAWVRAALAPFPRAAGAVVAIDAWVRRVAPNPALLRDAIAVLEAADPTGPFDPAPHFLAERYIIREAQKAPAQWLPMALRQPGAGDEVNPEVELVALAWAVPWERERTRRLAGLGFENGPPFPDGLVTGRPGAGLLIRPRLPTELPEFDRVLRWYRRVALLKLGLWAFRADHGRFPDPAREGLAALVPGGYLRRVPPDPNAEGRGFGYRLAPPGGEVLRDTSPNRPQRGPGGRDGTLTRFVPAGHAIVWSVGPDLLDQGGTQPPFGTTSRAEDHVSVIPPPP